MSTLYGMYFSPAGSIPLRHLVYRVHDLPQSLRPLVFDFGLLDPEVENQYIKLIVTSHLMSLKVRMPF